MLKIRNQGNFIQNRKSRNLHLTFTNETKPSISLTCNELDMPSLEAFYFKCDCPGSKMAYLHMRLALAKLRQFNGFIERYGE